MIIFIHHQHISVSIWFNICRQGSRALAQIVPKFVPSSIQKEANERMKSLLDERYAEAKSMIARNRVALDVLIEELLQHDKLSGDRVREIVEKHADKQDLLRRQAAKGAFQIGRAHV